METEVYTIMSTPFAFGGTHVFIKAKIKEYERIDIGQKYFGVVFKNPHTKNWHLALECCGALIGTDKSKSKLIKDVKKDIETGDKSLMKAQITMAKNQIKQAQLLETSQWFEKFGD